MTDVIDRVRSQLERVVHEELSPQDILSMLTPAQRADIGRAYARSLITLLENRTPLTRDQTVAAYREMLAVSEEEIRSLSARNLELERALDTFIAEFEQRGWMTTESFTALVNARHHGGE